ncbi:unnamed protein product, partial [Adineta steineri]
QDEPFSVSQQFQLGQTYYNTRIGIVEERLLQSGVRLATVINKIVELQKNNDKSCPGTVLIAIVLFFEVLLILICFIYYLIRRISDNYHVVKN